MRHRRFSRRRLAACPLVRFQIEWGQVFHDVKLKNDGAIVIPWFFTICG